MSNSYISGCGATVEIMEGCEARFDLRLGIEEIKIVIMGLKKRQKKAKTETTQNKFQLKIDELQELLDNLPEKAPWQREIDTGLYNS
tara:strand:+ start:1917 stop:2177 length:261 start_codon:yes stop_codon:yes gene_type:complete